jgi:phosphopantothenoylcysteine decarboxylase/phosphopantothenate--cysteine ligase
MLITGPSALADPIGVTVHRVETTAEMAAAVGAALPGADVLIMAAAPADYRAAEAAEAKRPRVEGALALSLLPTEDILLGSRAARKKGAVIVGFALETGDAVAKGRAKLQKKDLDLIVVNDALEAGAGFEVDTNRVTIVDRGGEATEVPLGSKRAVAEAVLDAVEARLGR